MDIVSARILAPTVTLVPVIRPALPRSLERPNCRLNVNIVYYTSSALADSLRDFKGGVDEQKIIFFLQILYKSFAFDLQGIDLVTLPSCQYRPRYPQKSYTIK